MFTRGSATAIRAGKKGGKARAAKLSARRLRESARKAVLARWSDPAQREAQRARMLAEADKLRAQGLVGPRVER